MDIQHPSINILFHLFLELFFPEKIPLHENNLINFFNL